MSEGSSRTSMRALEILEAFSEARRPLSLSEVARMTKMPISTCHGVFKALEQRGFLYFASGYDAYPTRRLWRIAHAINEHDPVALRLEPALAQLRDELGETVVLGVRHGNIVLYLLVLESKKSIRFSAQVGDRRPLHTASIGKVMLGAMSPDELDAWLKANTLTKSTEQTLTTAKRLRADLAASKARGYYMGRGEHGADVMGIAVPLLLEGSIFGVAIAGPLQRLTSKEKTVARGLAKFVESMNASA